MQPPIMVKEREEERGGERADLAVVDGGEAVANAFELASHGCIASHLHAHRHIHTCTYTPTHMHATAVASFHAYGKHACAYQFTQADLS